jgi:hypothetical protein
MSSSLAGALVPPDENATSADVDMHSSSFDDATPDTAADLDPKQEEEMGDLFGEDSNVDFVHHSRLVLHYTAALALPSLHPVPQRIQAETGIRPRAHQAQLSQDTLRPHLHQLRTMVFLPKTENEELWNMKKMTNPMPSSSTALRPRSRFLIFRFQRAQTDKCVVGTHKPQADVPISPSFPQHWVIRMPNFVRVDSKPFHPDTYVGPEQEDDFLGGTHERGMGIKLRVENTVRWRWTRDKDDQDVSPFFFFLIPYYKDLKSPWWRSVGNRTRMLSDGQMAQ